MSAHRHLCIAATAAFAVTAATAAGADDASRWHPDLRSAVRLLAGARSAGNPATLRAGIEMKMEPGWKTYWRYPGDSGVPPQFDFSGSDNVASVIVQWPAPHRFADGGGQSIGYEQNVIFPLRVTPKDAGRPVRLQLAMSYAVCEKLCIPAEGKAELALTGTATSFEDALRAAEARVPRRAALGEPGALSIRAVHREPADGKPRVVVDVAASAANVDLFAEGPSAAWALPLPEPLAGAPPGLRRFAFALDGLPPNTRADGATLTLTAIAGADAIEVPVRLD
jgi:DsbC/DsbD-like thiol-disulfide interchange protein